MSEENENQEDKESKTEEPTQRKLEQALERGQVISSREVSSFMLLLTISMIIIWILPMYVRPWIMQMRGLVEHAGQIHIDVGAVGIILTNIVIQVLKFLSPIFALLFVVSIFAFFIQQGEFVFSSHQIMPDLNRISITHGFKRIFSAKSFLEFIKNILKIGIVALFLYLIIIADIQPMRLYQDMSVASIIYKIYESVRNILICVSIATAAIAGIDYWYQRYYYFSSLMMSKQELKEEFKQTEGSPEIKSKIRSLRSQKAKTRMMSNVPKADVIITNPTHYAVALEYNEGTMIAPKVVAKGVDVMAAKIKDMAKQYDIPIIENKLLAQALYAKVKVDQIIPPEFYAAVAEIIGYIYKIKNKRAI